LSNLIWLVSDICILGLYCTSRFILFSVWAGRDESEISGGSELEFLISVLLKWAGRDESGI